MSEFRPGIMVVWKYLFEMDLPSEVGITIEKYKPPSIPGEYVKGLGDRVRMFPTRWLEVLL